MSDRGLPVADRAQACPFVAFENDRDERATSPDPRHRCYAEERPAPRAIAHQEAYCLAPAFPVCPIFQDWAQREAAHARAGSGAGSDGVAAGASAGAAGGAAAAGPAMFDQDEEAEDEDDGAPGFLASRSAAAGAAAGAGLVGSAADRLAGSEQSDGEGGREAPGYGVEEQERRRAARLEAIGTPDDRFDEGPDDLYDGPLDEDEFESDRPGRPRSARASGGIGFGRDRRPKVGDTRRAGGWSEAASARDQGRYPEPYQATRSRGPRVSRLAAMAIFLVVAAVALFFLPQLLGIGGTPPPGTAGPSQPPASSGPSLGAEPTTLAEPTPQIYIVKSGDSMFSIAEAFGITPDELIAANRETHPNPDQLQIGDQLIIPSPAPGGSAEPSPSGAF